MPRSNFVGDPVTYGAIGATQAADLLAYPPTGYRPEEHSVRLGSGAERFAAASAALMTWGVQRGAGIEVSDPRAGSGTQYGGPAEERFSADGTAYLTAGMTAVLKLKVGPVAVSAPVRVVYVIDEPERVGFAYGTLAGHPESGEESFVVEHRDDDSVWLVVRSFSKPAKLRYRLVAPVLRSVQKRYTKRYLRALHPAAAAS